MEVKRLLFDFFQVRALYPNVFELEKLRFTEQMRN